MGLSGHNLQVSIVASHDYPPPPPRDPCPSKAVPLAIKWSHKQQHVTQFVTQCRDHTPLHATNTFADKHYNILIILDQVRHWRKIIDELYLVVQVKSKKIIMSTCILNTSLNFICNLYIIFNKTFCNLQNQIRSKFLEGLQFTHQNQQSMVEVV
jgi:hypothetical protein